MRLIVITSETEVPYETEIIHQLFDAGMDLLHIRKPSFADQEMEQFLSRIKTGWYDRLVLHDCFEVGLQKGLRRFHLNGRHPLPPVKEALLLSRSCHSLEEVSLYIHEEYEYLFLSPVFDSISKKGYSAGFSASQLQDAVAEGVLSHKVIALGGITAANIPQVRLWGFGGVAVLGIIWGNVKSKQDIPRVIEQFKELKTVCEEKSL